MKCFFFILLAGCQAFLTDFEVLHDSDSGTDTGDTATGTETGSSSDSGTVPWDTTTGTETGSSSDSGTVPGDTTTGTETGSSDPYGYQCDDAAGKCDAHYCERMADCYGDCTTFAECWHYYCPPGTSWDGWMYLQVCP